MPTTEPVEPRSDLLRAMVLGSLLTADLTRLATDTLGGGNTGNREVQVLLLLHAQPGLTPSAVSRATGMTRGDVSRVLRKLKDADLLGRRPHPDDRRSARLYLTRHAQGRITAFEASVTSYFVSHSVTLEEIPALLGTGIEGESATAEGPLMSPIGLVEDLARVGAAFVDEVDTVAPWFGLTSGTDRAALLLIHHEGEVRPARLGSALHLTSGGATILLGRLERAGLVRRHRPDDAADRRAVLVSCTPRGRQAVAAILDVFAHHAVPVGEAFRRAERMAAQLASTA